MPVVTILIPFFQRERGLLRTALESIASQTVFPSRPEQGPGSGEALSAEILIVEDGSPIPAADEISGLALPEGLEIRVVHRENGGVPAARNTGLDEVHPETRLLAMLDSDDVWSPDHLERALAAHDLGADIYTSNWIPVESEQDAMSFFGKLDPADHHPVEGLEDAYEFVGDFTAQEFERSIGRPSALVFDWARFGDLRNDRRLVYGSEDQLWRLTMASRDPRVIFSSRVEVRSGSGVSVFSGLKWASERGMLAGRDRIYCAHLAARDLPLSPEARRARRRVVSSTRTAMMGTWIHLLRHGPRPGVGTIGSILKRDPAMAVLWPYHAAKVVARRWTK